MSETATRLRQALRARLQIIGDAESRKNVEAHVERLRLVSEQIDALAAALPRPLDPQFEHYLQRKSYDKALEFLEDR